MPFLSVIVCTYNRADLLDKCLASLCAQVSDRNLCEIIVVDNNSEDDTSSVVSGYIKKHENVRYIFEHNQGLSYARNRGCDEARGEYLVYIDDDAIAPPEYLATILKIITEYEPDILGGPVYPYYTSPKPRWFKDKYEIRKYEDKSGFSKTCSVSGGNYIIRKDVLRQLGMFDVTLGMKGNQIGLGEERAVLEAYRRKTPEVDQKVHYALECYVKHHVPPDKMTLKYMVTRYYQAGRTLARAKEKEPSAAIELVFDFVPELVTNLSDQTKCYGVRGADYIEIFGKSAIRIGNMVELLSSHGIKLVFKTVLDHMFGRMVRKMPRVVRLAKRVVSLFFRVDDKRSNDYHQ